MQIGVIVQIITGIPEKRKDWIKKGRKCEPEGKQEIVPVNNAVKQVTATGNIKGLQTEFGSVI